MRVVEKLTTRLVGFQTAAEFTSAAQSGESPADNEDEMKTVLSESVDLNMEYVQKLVRSFAVCAGLKDRGN